MGKSSKQQQAQQAREYRLQRQQEELEKQKQQSRIIRRTMLVVLAVILVAVGLGAGISAINNREAIRLSRYDYVTMTVSYTNANGEAREGEIVMKLYEDIAPITVKNFRQLVSEGFYDGLTFHRVIEGFMIQGGDPKGDGTGDSGTTIKGEFSSNGVKNNLLHKRGVVSMARGDNKNSASCQFFIVHKDSAHLNGDYAAFGEVVSGMNVVDEIAETEVYQPTGSGEKATPVNPVTIVKAELLKSVE